MEAPGDNGIPVSWKPLGSAESISANPIAFFAIRGDPYYVWHTTAMLVHFFGSVEAVTTDRTVYSPAYRATFLNDEYWHDAPYRHVSFFGNTSPPSPHQRR
jgi:hypothetical protein